MGYYEFKIEVAEESKDALIQRMSGMGCLGIVDNEKTLIVYFSDNDGITSILAGINSFPDILKKAELDSSFTYKYEFISERDWNESWKKKFVPIEVGDNFTILPPWETPPPGRIPLIIDPGMAFGTGHHETTRTCLALIEKYSRLFDSSVSNEYEILSANASCDERSFLDIGTGTGILAIAASKLGFRIITGVDIDPLAVDAATRNIKHNETVNIEIMEGTALDVEGKFDFIAANLMSEILIRIASDIASRLKPSGIALLSGMISGQEEDVLPVMEDEGLRIIERFIDGRWVSLILTH